MPWPHQPPARTEPYTEAELLDMYRSGDPVSAVIARAKRVNGWNRAKVREIIFGKAF
jgi:hypothetical protein